MDAEEIASSITNSLRDIGFMGDILSIPLADGGEGTSITLSDLFPQIQYLSVCDALGRKTFTSYRVDESNRKALIESAKIIGLPLLNEKERNPLLTSSFGLGEAIKYLIKKGFSDLTITLGGSATNDAGMGMLSALGFRFIDNKGNILLPNGENTLKIKKIIKSDFINKIKDLNINCICDVSNPLIGPLGASFIFSPQKGASIESTLILEQGLVNFAEVTEKEGFGCPEDRWLPGSGAAGGLGYALSVYLNGKLIPGIEYILEKINFDQKINEADLIITGEGKIDRQSLMGKVLNGILNKAKEKGIPVIGIGGKIEDKNILIDAGFKDLYEISDPYLSEEKNMTKDQTRKNIDKTIKQMSKNIFFRQFL